MENDAKNEIILNNLQNNIEQLLITHQIDKISLFTRLDSLSKEILKIDINNSNEDDLLQLNKKITNVEDLLEKTSTNAISKDDFMSTYLSSEFKEIKDSTLKSLRGEIEIKLQKENSKSKNGKGLLFFVLFISISSLLLSILTYLK